MPQEKTLRRARVIHQQLLCSQEHGVAGDLAGLAFDIAVMLRDLDGYGAERALNLIGEMTGHLGWMGICLGFTDIIGPTTSAQRDALFDLVDEWAFPQGSNKQQARLNRSQRQARRREVKHSLLHAVQWLHHHETDPVHALAYWMEIGSGENPVVDSRCYILTISALGLIAARRLRPAIAL